MSYDAGNRKIKVAYVLTPIDFGGSEKVSLNFLKNFNIDKFEIVPILLTRPWEEKKIFEKEISNEGLKYHTIPVAKRPAKEGKDYFKVLRCYRMLFTLLKEGRFDLVHTNGYFADILGGLATKIVRIPHVATCHGFIQNDKKLRLYNKIDILLLRWSNRIIAVSESIEAQLVGAGVSKDKVHIITNAVVLPDLEGDINDKKISSLKKSYNIKERQFVVGYVGRLSAEKGTINLLRSAIELKEKTLFFKIILIGDGPERENLMDFVSKNNLGKEVVFAGFLENPGELLPLLDVFVLPSLTEGTPMALLEAMSYGVPVVASRVGGIPDVISHNVDGVLTTPGNSQAVTESIMALSLDQVGRKSMSKKARGKIRDKYGVTPWCNKIESLYLSVVGGRVGQKSCCGEVGS